MVILGINRPFPSEADVEEIAKAEDRSPVTDAVIEAYHQCLDATELIGRLFVEPTGIEQTHRALWEALSATRAAVAAVRHALVEDHDQARETRHCV